MALAEVASLWIGPQLSWLEQLCIKSFLDHGHSYTLFTYDKVENVPEGVRVEPASSFLPADKIIRHQRTGSPAYHADMFRLRMIMNSDLTWVDTDILCVQPFSVPRSGHLHGWITDDVVQINNAVLKLPKKSKTLKAMLDFTSDEYPIPPWYKAEKQAELRDLKAKGQGVHVSILPWGVWGPDALTHFLHDTGEVKFSQEGHVIYPVPFGNKRSLLKPQRRAQVEDWVKDDTWMLHFWGRRFNSAASETGGIPHPRSYTAMLLERHGVDPAPTAHLMKKIEANKPPGKTDTARIDFSALNQDDVANLVLQRSGAVDDQKVVRAWMNGDEEPLTQVAEENREDILTNAFDELQTVFQSIAPKLDKLEPRSIADIGAGYAFIDLMLHRKYGSDIVLIDIEESEDRHFGMAKEGAGYSSLEKARDFLITNGVPKEKIRTINPQKDDLAEAGMVDLAMSLISCGFHYPADTYDAFFESQVSPTGGILLDIRKGSGGIGYMKKFGRTKVLANHDKHACVFVRKRVV